MHSFGQQERRFLTRRVEDHLARIRTGSPRDRRSDRNVHGALLLGCRTQNRYRAAVPIFYECQRCTACCRWPGQVRLTDEEITRMAAFKQMSEFDFIQRYLHLRQDRRGLALQNKPNGECIFLEGNNCAVQPVKPQQCRDFPNLWNFPGFEKVCHAVPRMVDEVEFKRLVAEATGREI